MYNCQYCNKEFNTKRGLVIHIQSKHNKLQDYDSKYKFWNYILENKPIPKCEICGINDIVVNSHRGSHICNNFECKHKYLSNNQNKIQQNHPELKENARQRRIKYLRDKSNFNSTAFGKRANKELSYLEKWFFDNIIQKYNLTDKYTIINEYTEYKYFLDFAFINIKLDVELDGKCHFNNDDSRIQHDIDRDNYLQNKGWKIFRISWYDVKYNEIEIINKFMSLLNDNEFEYDKSYYIRHKVITNKEFKYQEEQRNKKKENIEYNKKVKIQEKRNIFIDLEKNSNIDFSKFGWVTLASKYLQSKGHIFKQLTRDIKKYYPDFYIHNIVYTKLSNRIGT